MRKSHNSTFPDVVLVSSLGSWSVRDPLYVIVDVQCVCVGYNHTSTTRTKQKSLNNLHLTSDFQSSKDETDRLFRVSFADTQDLSKKNK